MSEDKKIVIDEDWKSQVAAEREEAEREAQESRGGARAPAPHAAGGPDQALEASFDLLVTTFFSEALVALGVEGDGDAVPVEPRVVFLDLNMPRVDGMEVLRRLRATPRTRELPVVILSWSKQREDVESCYALGANSFLVKRISLRNPGGYFAEAVRYWVALNQPPVS